MNIKQQKASTIIKVLKKLFPDAGMILTYSNNWELLVAVMLSAQCTDVQVNKVTAKLFQKYKTLEDYIIATPEEFQKDIFSTGFYKNKTKNVLAAARKIKYEFGGEVPRTMTELLSLPGVARKTANVVLGNAFQVYEGIAVDTHVGRLAQKIGLTKHSDPNKIEQDLIKIVPQKEWFHFTYLLIEYGRKYCIARKHDHDKCPLTSLN